MTETLTQSFSAIINRPELQYALGLANDIIRARTPKPILQCVKIESGDGVATMYATDLERSVVITLRQLQIESPGSFCVPCEKLLRIVQTVFADTLTLRIEGAMCIVSAGEREWKMANMEASEFPPLAFTPEGDEITVDGSNLGLAIRMAKVCIDTSAATGAMSGRNALFIHAPGDSRLLVAGTDSRALCESVLECNGAKWNGMISHTNIGTIEKLCESGEVTISMSDRQAYFTAGDLRYVTSKIEGEYFQYTEIMKLDEIAKLNAPREELLETISSVAVVLAEESKAMVWDLSKTGLILSAVGLGADSSKAPLACKYTGEPMRIGLNPKWISGILKCIEADEVTVGFVAPNRPISIRGQNFTFIQMPTNLA